MGKGKGTSGSSLDEVTKKVRQVADSNIILKDLLSIFS
jgi:hypothetical protein